MLISDNLPKTLKTLSVSFVQVSNSNIANTICYKFVVNVKKSVTPHLHLSFHHLFYFIMYFIYFICKMF